MTINDMNQGSIAIDLIIAKKNKTEQTIVLYAIDMSIAESTSSTQDKINKFLDYFT